MLVRQQSLQPLLLRSTFCCLYYDVLESVVDHTFELRVLYEILYKLRGSFSPSDVNLPYCIANDLVYIALEFEGVNGYPHWLFVT